MITQEQMVAEFQSYLAHHDGYIPGTSGELWTQTKQDKKAQSDAMVAKYGEQWIGHHVEDCSGAVVRACRKYGIRIYQGSNRIAREYVTGLLPLSSAQPGMMAFKLRKPGEKYYDLPSEYKEGHSHYNGDLIDYYHIGCVDTNTKYVLNSASTKTGFIRSSIDGWACVGWLKCEEMEKEPMTEQTMIVTTNKVNLRAAPEKDAARVEWLNAGDVVKVRMIYDNGWDYVQHGEKSGYVMARYLQAAEDAQDGPAMPDAPDEARAWLDKALAANEQEHTALVELQKLITGAVG